MIGGYLDIYTFDYLLRLGLSEVPDTVDKREGSPVHDAAASTARQLERGFKELKKVYNDTFAQYSFGEQLRLRTAENGVNIKEPSKAVRKGTFVGNDSLPYTVPLGARFGTIDGAATIIYTVVSEIIPGSYRLEAEDAGTIGNEYLGALLPLGVMNNLKSAMLTDIIVPGEDVEPDEILRARYFDEKNSKKFGGNIDQYREWITQQDGISACQIYPVWNGGGTVKISFVDSTYSAATQEHVRLMQAAIDPTQDGQGLGIAPIDHIVTVATPAAKTIGVSATVRLAPGYTIAQLQPLIEAAVEKYFTAARVDWGEPAGPDNNDYSLTIFRSQVSAAIVSVQGVLNASALNLNGLDADIELSENARLQELPVLGVVSLA